MKISIIIPIYNVAEYIERCLISVFEQTYPNIEILLIDDCTPDDSVVIAKAIIDKYSKQNIINIIRHDENQGLSEARNTGINNSSGDYLYFLDSDDSIEPFAMEKLLGVAIENDSDITLGGVNVINSDLRFILPYKAGECISNKEKIREGFFNNKWYVMACNKLVKREFIFNNDLFFESGIYHEDILWSFNLSIVAESISFFPEGTYNYFIRKNSITTAFNTKNVYDLLFIYNKIYSSIFNTELYEDPDTINYLENLRTHILFLPIKREIWKDIYKLLKSEDKISFSRVFKHKTSYKVKIKKILWLLPPIVAEKLFFLNK